MQRFAIFSKRKKEEFFLVLCSHNWRVFFFFFFCLQFVWCVSMALFVCLLVYILNLAYLQSVQGENWEVCTLEGLLSLSEITAYQLSPEFTRIREV